jgi:hypothetical protein
MNVIFMRDDGIVIMAGRLPVVLVDNLKFGAKDAK